MSEWWNGFSLGITIAMIMSMGIYVAWWMYYTYKMNQIEKEPQP